jgi:DNA-binding NtrC family response regulator
MMPRMDGFDLTVEVKKVNPGIPVIIVTAYASIDNAVKAMKAGAFDYITKPVLPEELRIKVGKALDQFKLRAEITTLKEQVSRAQRATEFIGESPAIRKVLDIVSLVSQRQVPVALLGESGTGKELLARAIHFSGSRSPKPFVPINCGALPETLLESELFGYVKGAFTCAAGSKKGLFEEADGGTLFLDEIADAPSSIQMKLLRALEEGEIRRLGSTKTVELDVRVICATNKNLDEEIAAGRFREDLYYRLAVVTIQVPSLRERKEDIPLLADHFVAQYRETINPDVRGISSEARRALMAYDWPGNVRELENLIRRGLVLCRGEWMTVKEMMLPNLSGIPEEIQAMAEDDGLSLAEAQKRFLHRYFTKALVHYKGNIPRIAEEAEVSRKNVYDHLRRLDLSPSDFRGN